MTLRLDLARRATSRTAPPRPAPFRRLLGVIAGLMLSLAPAASGAVEADCAAAAALSPDEIARVEHGREAFEVCRPCHDIGGGAQNRTGPLLNDLFGRKAGHVEGYPSSMPMVFAGERGLVWTDETLMAYLDDPLKLVPGSEMPLIGVETAATAADLVAFLKVASADCGDFNARPDAVRHRSAPIAVGP